MVTSVSTGPIVLPNSKLVSDITLMYIDDQPEIDTISSVTLSFAIQPYKSNGGVSSADMIYTKTITIDN